MNYGFFDVQNKEYVITRPDTPTPWINYLGFGGFGSFISNNGGGLLFDGDPGKRRLTRYHYNVSPMDRPGRYVYIKDTDTGEYWSPTWQPVLKKPEKYECRHGLSYSVITTQYSGIETEMTFFIPENKNYEVWDCRIRNHTDRKRNFKLFPYVEFSYHNASVDIMAEWARYTMNCCCRNKTICFDCSPEVHHFGLYGFLSTTLDAESYECARDRFIGRYRDESNPIAVENGYCTSTDNNADNSCGALCCPLSLEAGEEKRFIVAVGSCKEKEAIDETVKAALNFETADIDLANIKKRWEKDLSALNINTPDSDVNKMINIWHAYQCHTTFNWSRYISYYERGSGRGWGFRDSMQDVLGIMHAIPEKAKERMKILLGMQFQNGSTRIVYYPSEKRAAGGGRSDDHLWSVYSVCAYIKETGDYGFLDEKIPYVDGGEGTVLEHLTRGLQYTKQNVGKHNIPKFLVCDWNDSLAAIGEGGEAESAFVFFQAAAAAYDLKELLNHLGRDSSYVTEYYELCRKEYKKLWDGKWFIRAYTDKGEKYGTDEDEFNKIFLNPQSWAVLSRLPSKEEANEAFDNVNKYLFCKYGYISHYPASSGYNRDKKSFFEMRNGIKENGGVFCHAATWAIIAQTLLRRNDDAFRAYKAALPCLRNDDADTTLIEPYVYGSALLGPSHERYGAGSNSWLTGTAAWTYYAVTQYILGFRTEYDGIRIDPCIPSDWDGFSMTRKYRGIVCRLKVKGSGTAKKVSVDGVLLKGSFIPYEMIKGKKEVEITALLEK